MSRLPILYYYLQEKYKRNFHSQEQLEYYQDKMVQKHIKEILKHSSFYKSYYEDHFQGSIPLERWKDYPIIDKSIMMEQFDTLNTVHISKEQAFDVAFRSEETRDFSPKIGDITIGLSSGTSGNRGIFLVSPKEQARWAGTIIAKVLPTSLLKKNRVAFFLRANSNLYSATKGGTIQFSFFDLLDDFEHHISRLNQYQPTILIAPPSMLRLLAKSKKEGKLSISPLKIVSVAEVLEPLDKKEIENAFQQIIHQVYQCTEGFLGITCEHGTLHLNEDIAVFQKEFLNEEKTKFVPIITDFMRTTQPIIRYRLNDILTLKKEGCTCGSVFTALEQIEGRCDDIFEFQHATISNKTKHIFPDFIRRILISSSPNILEYRVIQHNINEIEIMFTCEGQKETELQMQIKDVFSTFLKEQECIIPSFYFSTYRQQEKGKKLKRIERK